MSSADGRTHVILLISHLTRGGAETQLVELARTLPRDRHLVEVVLIKSRNDFSDALAASGVPVTSLGQRGPLDVPRVLLALYRVLRRRKPDVLHSYLYFGNLLAALAGRAARVPALVVSQRLSYVQPAGRPFWPGLGRLAHRLAGRLIVNARAIRDEELAAGFPATRIDHVPNGVRLPAIEAIAPAFLEGRPRILCVGRLDPQKGHDLLLAAWPGVLAAHPQAVLSLVGDGPQRAALGTQAQRLGIASRVRFLGFQASAMPWLLGCDVYVHASLAEGMPNAVMEAMAAGRPVVATAAGGTVELMVDGETGVLVPPGDVRGLEAALLGVLAQPERWSQWGAAARTRMQQSFSFEACAAATAAIYQDMLTPPERLP